MPSSINLLRGFLDSVELKRLRPSRNNLRSEMGSLEELMLSINRRGLLEPIVVRPMDGYFEVVAGNRRFEACKMLRMSKIPCHIVELDDREAFEVSLIENVQRETLNPIDEAQAFKRYVDDHGYGAVSELARKISKSHVYVIRRIQLLSLPKKVRDEVVRRRTPPSIAQELVSLDDEDMDEVLEEVHERHLSMREVRRTVAKRHRRAQQGELSFTSDFYGHNSDASERRVRIIDRAIRRAMTSLKMDMCRLGEVIEDVEDEWVVREMLFQCRASLNEQVESLLRFRKKLILRELEQQP